MIWGPAVLEGLLQEPTLQSCSLNPTCALWHVPPPPHPAPLKIGQITSLNLTATNFQATGYFGDIRAF